jgi:cytochrome c oxidase subunit IV
VANHAVTPSDLPGGHPTHAFPTPRKYVIIAAILFVVTAVEVAASFLVRLGLPNWVQVTALLTLASLKGALVVLFYMHLRFDSRWFSMLFLSGLFLGALCVIAFILLFAYHASVVIYT